MRRPYIDLFPGVFLLLISFSFFFFIFVDSYNDIFQNGAEAGKNYATCYRHKNAIEEWLNVWEIVNSPIIHRNIP